MGSRPNQQDRHRFPELFISQSHIGAREHRSGFVGKPRGRGGVAFALGLAHLGLAERATLKAGGLSGGERGFTCAALVTVPSFVADEPTGSLDADGQSVMSIIGNVHREFGTAVIVVTHDEDVAACAVGGSKFRRPSRSTVEWGDVDARAGVADPLADQSWPFPCAV